MTFSTAYLTPAQVKIWSLRKAGVSQSEIARKLEITRQAVNKSIIGIDSKILFAMNEFAVLNRIEPRYMSSVGGIMIGRSAQFNVDVLVTLSEKSSLQVWYSHTADCDHCRSYHFCRDFVLSEVERRGARLTPDERKLHPAKIARILFTRLGAEIEKK